MTYAIIAGICAAGAGFFGKLPSISNEQQVSWRLLNKMLTFNTIPCPLFQYVYPWLWVAICVALVLCLNGVMWTFYTKAMQERGGSLIATAVSSGTNYLFSVSRKESFTKQLLTNPFLQAVLGTFVFGEKTSTIWWLGMSLVVLGLFVVNHDQNREKKER